MTDSDPTARLASAEAVGAWLTRIDPADVRPDHTFADAAGTALPGRRGADTPRGATMVPGSESWGPEAAPEVPVARPTAPAPPPKPAPPRRAAAARRVAP